MSLKKKIFYISMLKASQSIPQADSNNGWMAISLFPTMLYCLGSVLKGNDLPHNVSFWHEN